LLKAFESFDRQKVNQFAKLDRRDFAIPTHLRRDLVVGDVGAHWGVSEMSETDKRERGKPFQLRRLDTIVAAENHIHVVDRDRI
jgi:hypothetical protein